MSRVAIYHWLPIAANMLSSIEHAIARHPTSPAHIEAQEGDGFEYNLPFNFTTDEVRGGDQLIRGKINLRGFAQHSVEVPAIDGVSLGMLLEELVAALRAHLATVLYDIVPPSTQNKMAVLEEGIVGFTEFFQTPFPSDTSGPGKDFLKRLNVVSVILDTQHNQHQIKGLHTSFGIDLDKLSDDVSSSRIAKVSDDGQTYFSYFSSPVGTEGDLIDGGFYKLCALNVFAASMDRTIKILVDARDHVIPIRREMAIALQRRQSNGFTKLQEIKDYLSYSNVKLPVIQKVINYMQLTQRSTQFKSKALLDDEIKKGGHPTLGLLKSDRYTAKPLSDKIAENVKRLQTLYREDATELEVLSSEVSHIFTSNILSASMALESRSLDTVQASLEIGRSGRNRENALAILSIVLSANLGIAIANLMTWEPGYGLAMAIALVVVFWIWAKWTIAGKSSSFRLHVPVSSIVHKENLEKYLHSRPVIRAEGIGTRHSSTWRERLLVKTETRFAAPHHRKVHVLCRLRRECRQFSVTLDYARDGFVESVSLEHEGRGTARFSTKSVIVDVFAAMAEMNCFVPPENSRLRSPESVASNVGSQRQSHGRTDVSLLASVMYRMDVPIHPSLPHLNRILATPVDDLIALALKSSQDPHGAVLTPEDADFLDEIAMHREAYIRWLEDQLVPIQRRGFSREQHADLSGEPEIEDCGRGLLLLLGRQNLRSKIAFLTPKDSKESHRDAT